VILFGGIKEGSRIQGAKGSNEKSINTILFLGAGSSLV